MACPEARAGTMQAVVIARTLGAGFERSGETLIGEEAVSQGPRNVSCGAVSAKALRPELSGGASDGRGWLRVG